MAAILDIIIAFGLGGILLIIILNANDIAGTQASVLNGDMLVQQMIVGITTFMEGEFRNMGVGVHMDSATIKGAGGNAIKFLSDLDPDADLVVDLDTILYYMGPLSDLASTQNDSDRLLYRKVNSELAYAVGAVTNFQLRFYSQGQVDTLVPPNPPAETLWTARRPSGVSTENPFDFRQIKVIQLTLEVQNPYAIYKRADDPTAATSSALYSSTMWRQTRLASQNLRR